MLEFWGPDQIISYLGLWPALAVWPMIINGLPAATRYGAIVVSVLDTPLETRFPASINAPYSGSAAE